MLILLLNSYVTLEVSTSCNARDVGYLW